MSHIITNQVRELKTGNATAKAVLLRLADYANDAGECFPSTTRIADELELSRQAVSNAIKRLESIGLIKISRETGRHNYYQVTPENYKLVDKNHDKPVNDDYTSSKMTRNPSLRGCNPSLHEPVNLIDTNHHRTINNHHTGGGDMRARENSTQQKSDFEFQPVPRKYSVPYQTHDYELQNFETLESRYDIENHFKSQAQVAFQDLSTSSIELIFSEFKRFWLDRSGKTQSPHKWMSQWITRVEFKHAEYVQRQNRVSQASQAQPVKQSAYQAKQDNVSRWKSYGQQATNQFDENRIIDVVPDNPKTFLIEGVGHA